MAIAHSLGSTITIGGSVASVESASVTGKLEVAEVRTLDGTKVKRVAGLIDDGTIEITGVADGSNFNALMNAMTAGSAVSCSLTASDGSSVAFDAFVTEVKLIAEVNDAVKFSATLAASGS